MARRLPTIVIIFLLCALIGGPATPAWTATAPRCEGTHWVGAWSAAPGDAVNQGFTEQTLRMIVHPHFGGERLRLRLTNRFGSQPVTFGEVRVARRASGAAVTEGTNRPVTFGGKGSVTVPAGADVVSDVVDLRFPALTDLVVSVYAQGVTGPATEHFTAMQTSYTSDPGSGNHAADTDGSAFGGTTTSWFYLEGVDVAAPRSASSVVTLGDSITDGYIGMPGFPYLSDSAALDTNGRYPDVLARRLGQRPGQNRLSVLNAGISGNRVASDGFIPMFGPSAVSRLADDVLAQPGVTDVIVMEGTNDLGLTPLPSAQQVIEGLDHIVRRLQSAGLNVVLGTIPPAEGAGPGHGTTMATAERDRVNAWITGRPHGVDVVDFDAVLRDPAHPKSLRPEYDSGDRLHPNLAGYRAMAEAIDLDVFEGVRCAA